MFLTVLLWVKLTHKTELGKQRCNFMMLLCLPGGRGPGTELAASSETPPPACERRAIVARCQVLSARRPKWVIRNRAAVASHSRATLRAAAWACKSASALCIRQRLIRCSASCGPSGLWAPLGTEIELASARRIARDPARHAPCAGAA